MILVMTSEKTYTQFIYLLWVLLKSTEDNSKNGTYFGSFHQLKACPFSTLIKGNCNSNLCKRTRVEKKLEKYIR